MKNFETIQRNALQNLKYLVLGISLLVFNDVVSQNNLLSVFSASEQLGDKYFEKYAFVDALESYKKAHEKDKANDKVRLKIAECYRMLNDPLNSSEWYGSVLSRNSEVEPSYVLNYADALSSIGKYEDAKIWYEKYKQVTEENSLADSKITGINNREKLYSNAGAVNIEKASFNSGYSDFSPAYYNNGLVFLSARPPLESGTAAYNWDKSNFLDIYEVAYDKPPVAFSGSINSKYHEGPLVFFDDFNKLMFTRDNFENGKLSKSKNGVIKLKLYYAERNRTTGEWSTPSPLPFNNDEYSIGHPAISKDGKVLYFVSDMPGGYGGTDIYKSEFIDNQWQQPVNLGSNINTAGNEMFPFLHNDKELFFASSGHGGLGGLDMFVTDISKGPDSKIFNLGSPLNSGFDDFGFILSNKGENGYFSSNREGGKNQDNIYAFTIKGSFIRETLVKGKVINQVKNEVISGASVVMEDERGKTISTANSGEDGGFSFAVEAGKKYLLKARKEGFFENSLAFATDDSKKEECVHDLYLMNNYSFMLVGEIFEKNSEKPVKDALVKIIDNFTGKEVLNGFSSEEGTFSYFIKEKKLNERISYHVHLEKSGYLSKNFVFNDSLTQPGAIHLKKYFDLNLDKVDLGMDIGKLADINPIYFDLGKATIRKDAAKELDKIVKIMRENPSLEIELGSHTDSRGSDASNLVLSDKRAKASADYIAGKGIDKARIVGKGYGESQLINECTNDIKCAEEQHQENRRTEFKVVKY